MSLRVGMVAPVTYAYGPSGYGPWERVTHDLTEALVDQGVEVTLFAPSGSETTAHLVETLPAPLGEMSSLDPRLGEEMHLAIAMESARSGGLEIIHSHLHVHCLVYSRLIPQPLVTTLHGVAWNQAHHPLLMRYQESAFVSLSRSERAFLPGLNYVATIGNGISLDDFSQGPGDGGYLAFVGRMAPEKAPDLAIEIARRSGMPLRIAGPVESQHRDFFEALDFGVDVEYLGPLDRSEVARLLGRARALLMPLTWDEPFGLVVVESLATGTPVVAWRRGAMPEIVDHGVTGFLVDSVDEAVDAVGGLPAISREKCRAEAESRHSRDRMARDYHVVYQELVEAQDI